MAHIWRHRNTKIKKKLINITNLNIKLIQNENLAYSINSFITSLGQMALESTICGIVHHARRTRAHCPTMVSSFKLSSGTVCLLGFSCRAGHIRKDKYMIAVPTSAVLHLVGTTNHIFIFSYITSSATKPE